MVDLLLRLQIFNFSTHHKKCKRANNHNKSILKSIFDVRELSFSLFCFFIGHLMGVSRGNLMFLYSFIFVCVTMYLCLLTATLASITFILSSFLHGSPFVLPKILVKFLFVLQTNVLFPPAVSECAILCIHFTRMKMRSVCLLNFVRLH